MTELKDKINLRKCNKCGEVKQLEDFKKDRRNKSGYAAICKPCHNKMVAEYYRQEGERLIRSRYHKLNSRVRRYGNIEALEYEDFLDLIAHDNPAENKCSYCGKSEQDELDEFNIRLAVDHIQPTRWGSPHALWNVTLACRSCNSSKGLSQVLEFYTRSENFTETRLNTLIKQMAAGNNCSVEDMEYLLYTSYMAETHKESTIEIHKADHRAAIKELTKMKLDKLTPQVKAVI